MNTEIFPGMLETATLTHNPLPPRVRYVREFTLEGQGVNREEFEVDLADGDDPVDILSRLRSMAEGTPVEASAG